ncbi:MAG: PTS mannitol transporter subunit IICB, partial [Psychrobacillus psychrodurans]
IGPAVNALTDFLAAGVQFIFDAGLLPLASIFIEPAKVLFLNNAINHGILGPLGIEQAADAGKSILFLLESNPGPGLGILLAFMIFGKGAAKQTAPGAVIIHFLGGIHEIYFPYILMKPFLLVAAIAGGASGIFTLQLFNAGLVAAPSPGSIFSILALTPKGSHIGVILAVVVATAVSFLIASLILKTSKDIAEDDLVKATEKTSSLKGKESRAAEFIQPTTTANLVQETSLANVKHIIFACDAGMGSSAMGASILRNKMKKEGLDVSVTNTAISNLPSDAEVIVTHKDLTSRAKEQSPNAYHISVENFLNSPKYDELIEQLKK